MDYIIRLNIVLLKFWGKVMVDNRLKYYDFKDSYNIGRYLLVIYNILLYYIENYCLWLY